MPVASASALVDALSRFRLLEAGQLAELTCQIQPRFPEAKALLQELIRRGWLSPFQANLLYQERAGDLVLGSYLLLDRIGEGGMGQVYKARHARLGRLVALKAIRKDRLANSAAVRRFRREIQVAAQLHHPNIVLAYDADEANGTHFFAMEYIEGIDLAHLVKEKGPLPIAEACEYVRQAALGLQHAHERGLVHRDIKPSNLMVNKAQGSQSLGLLKILDMGLARITTDPDGGSSLTHENAVLGTPDYIAPEQTLNARTADIRADLYSLGCTLYFLLTGGVPFPGTSLGEKLVKHQLHEPEPLESLRPDVPAVVVAIVRKLMSKKPEQRFQTPAELAAALAHMPAASLKATQRIPILSALPLATAIPGSTEPGLEATPPRPLTRRRQFGFLIAGATVLFVGLVALLFVLLARPGGASRPTGPIASQPDTRPKPVVNSIGMAMMRIPAGKFIMGSPDGEVGRKPHEGPQHEVTISRPFFMGMHEVTAGQFRAFVQETKYLTDGEREGSGAFRYAPNKDTIQDPKCVWHQPGYPLRDDQPVVCVSKNDATAFCQWLAKKEGKSYRLPTEAEWEYACRAGTMTPWNVGMSMTKSQAHFSGAVSDPAATGKPAKVGSYPPNAFGLHDMHGNVWEWVADGYDENYYRSSPPSDPTGPTNSSYAILRGGGWEEDAEHARSAFRFAMSPGFRHVVIGFRVVHSE